MRADKKLHKDRNGKENTDDIEELEMPSQKDCYKSKPIHFYTVTFWPLSAVFFKL